MPPKKDEKKPEKKKPEGPKELCGCGVNTYRAPPKGKKKVEPVVHAPNCTFQRATCNRYPHLPKCVNCEEGGCQYCLGTNPWCLYCQESKCKFLYKRDVLGWVKESGAAGNTTGGGGVVNADGSFAPSSPVVPPPSQ
jgi:hypothetical protein